MSKLMRKTRPHHRTLFTLLFLVAVLALIAGLGTTGCSEADEPADTDTTVAEAMSNEDGTAAEDDGTRDTTSSETGDDEQENAGDRLSAEDEDDATDMAGAYLVARTDFTKDQFDWEIVSVAEDNEGQPWVKVIAAPKDDQTIETYYVYVLLPTDFEMWNVYGMGTDAEPIDESNMPEEIQGKL